MFECFTAQGETAQGVQTLLAASQQSNKIKAKQTEKRLKED